MFSTQRPNGDVGLRFRGSAVVLIIVLLIGTSLAANHIYERSVIKGVGYRSHELIAQTSDGYSGQKIVEKISGSGSFDDRTEFELDRIDDSINYTQEAYFEYFPVSYQTGTYDQKWVDKICVQNYDAGGVITEQYSHVESLQKSTEIRSIGNSTNSSLEAYIDSNVIGVAHIGWLSREKRDNRYFEIGRSVEDTVGVFSIGKHIQLLENKTEEATRVDWLPCI
jgi:hypothetical protein